MSGTSKLDSLPDFAREYCYEVDGWIMPKLMPREYLDDLKKFEVRSDDTYLVTWPKSGTTWMQNILTLVFADGNVDKANEKHLFKRVPFLEMPQSMDIKQIEKGMYEIANRMAPPRLMKTQLPPPLLPHQLEDQKPNIIYVARNPKDAAVSYFHFCNLSPNLPSFPEWGDFYTEFVKDRIPRGSWFEHVLYWWGKRNQPNVFFITYEEMQQDLRSCVVRVCKFLGKNFSDDVIDMITNRSTFSAMKKDPNSNPDTLPSLQPAAKQGKSFLRRGVVGDWKNYFTVEQSEEFDEIYKQKMAGSRLVFQFE